MKNENKQKKFNGKKIFQTVGFVLLAILLILLIVLSCIGNKQNEDINKVAYAQLNTYNSAAACSDSPSQFVNIESSGTYMDVLELYEFSDLEYSIMRLVYNNSIYDSNQLVYSENSKYAGCRIMSAHFDLPSFEISAQSSYFLDNIMYYDVANRGLSVGGLDKYPNYSITMSFSDINNVITSFDFSFAYVGSDNTIFYYDIVDKCVVTSINDNCVVKFCNNYNYIYVSFLDNPNYVGKSFDDLVIKANSLDYIFINLYDFITANDGDITDISPTLYFPDYVDNLVILKSLNIVNAPLNERIRILEHDKSIIQEQLTTANASVLRMQNEITALNKQINDLENNVDILNERISQLQQQLTTATEQASLAYDRGYSEGNANATAPSTALGFIGSIFHSIGSFLDIELFNGFTLGALLSIPLICALVFAILKIVRG